MVSVFYWHRKYRRSDASKGIWLPLEASRWLFQDPSFHNHSMMDWCIGYNQKNDGKRMTIYPSNPPQSPCGCEKIPFSPPPCPSPIEGEGISSCILKYLPSPLAGEGRVRGGKGEKARIPINNPSSLWKRIELFNYFFTIPQPVSEFSLIGTFRSMK